MHQNLVTHDIYADNLLLGKSLLFTLSLPPEWQLAPGVSRPEVFATHERHNRKWVATGRAWYVVFDGERHWAFELAASIHPFPNSPRTPTSEPLSIAGHPAQLRWKKKRRGLPWQRHTVTFMTVDFDCPLSERHLQLELSGWCPAEGFQEILQALRHLGCH
jgi:hypothetical protein